MIISRDVFFLFVSRIGGFDRAFIARLNDKNGLFHNLNGIFLIVVLKEKTKVFKSLCVVYLFDKTRNINGLWALHDFHMYMNELLLPKESTLPHLFDSFY